MTEKKGWNVTEMSINISFAVSIEANRKKQEMQREAVLWSRKVFKSLPEAKRNYENTLGCFIQQCCTFFGRGGITIGNDVFIGPKVNLITINHDPNPENRSATYGRPIVIEDKAWIGINSTILPGVRIGYGAIVGAGSVVTKDVPPMTVVAGNPARFIKGVEARWIRKHWNMKPYIIVHMMTSIDGRIGMDA